MKLVVLGSPGAGKGTYTQELERRTGIKHISTGDLLREYITKDNSLAIKVKKFMTDGKLVPDELVIEIIISMLKEKNLLDNFVLDGFPRTIEQAKALDEFIKIDKVINFTTSREIILDRLSGRLTCEKCSAIFHERNIIPKVSGFCDFCGGYLIQRNDDKRETVEKRLDEYDSKTAPLIQFYEKRGILKTLKIDKEFGPYKEEIMPLILDAVYK